MSDDVGSPDSARQSVGYIGLGHMGRALARRLVAGGDLRVFDKDGSAVEALAATGATASGSPRDVASHADVVFLCLPTSDHVRAVLFGEDGVVEGAKPGTVIVDQTTGDPRATRSMAAELATRGVTLIDAPVSGGVSGAEAGTIAIMVGADTATYARVRPVLAEISPNIFHTGDVGSGHVIKLVNNLLSHSQRLLSLEAMSLAAKNGVDPARAVEVLVASGGRNAFLERRMNPVIRGDLAVGFTLGLAHKDVRLACQLGIDSGVPMYYGNLSRETYQILVNEFGGDAEVDHAALFVDRVAETHLVPDGDRRN